MFQDRLVNNEDRLWFDQKMRSKMKDFGVQDSKVLGEGPLLYGDFMVPNSDNKIYEEILDQAKVRFFELTEISISKLLSLYNSLSGYL